LQEEHLTR
ncbi:hypothetical protein CISIN_1g0354272mg, partial [Citrus sinensis]